jgi:hypothetical protein
VNERINLERHARSLERDARSVIDNPRSSIKRTRNARDRREFHEVRYPPGRCAGFDPIALSDLVKINPFAIINSYYTLFFSRNLSKTPEKQDFSIIQNPPPKNREKPETGLAI